MEEPISLLSFAFRLFGCSLPWLPASVLKGHYGQGFLPGNLRTLATAYQANFNTG